MKAQGAYIACCVWGNNPNELENNNSNEMPGRDVPVSMELLGRL